MELTVGSRHRHTESFALNVLRTSIPIAHLLQCQLQKQVLGSNMSRKRLTLTDKVKIIEESLTPNFSPEKTGKQYGIHRTTVVKLLKKKDSILQPSKISRVVQNWGQLEGFPNYPGGMESLLKIENSIMLKRLQYKNKLLTFASECR